MDVVEEHLDVLQNIESVIVSVSRRDPVLVDFDVENAVNGLITKYQAQAQNHEARTPNLNERARKVYDHVEAVCEWRLGKAGPPGGELMVQGAGPEPVSLEVIVACLKRIRKSIQKWNKQGGRQGYLTYIQRFIV